MRTSALLMLGIILAGVPARGDTSPPVDIPALRGAQSEDAAIASIDAQIRRGEWGAALDRARAALDRSKRVFHGALQRALVRAALLEARLGQEEEARGHWEALNAMGGASLAAPLEPLFGPQIAKLRLAPSRAPGEVPPGVEGEKGEGLVPPRRTGGETPVGDAGCAASRGALWARLEGVVDTRGRLTLPAISGPSVCFSFEVLKATRGWAFEPARRAGKPVAAIYVETIHPPGRIPLRRLAGDDPAALEVVSLLEAGKFRAADRLAERRWNAALDAGSPSRPRTVALMALRAIALAARDDPDDQRRAGCLSEAAQGEEPAFYDLDLSPFGPAGRRLDAHRWGAVRSRPMEDLGEAIERPRIVPESRRLPRERFSPGDYGANRVFIEAVIDENGALREPLLFGPRDGMKGLDLEALDAVCSWRFRPATAGGKPVPLLYVLGLSVGSGAGPSR